MSGPNPQSLLKDLLDPLIDDFRYWFGRSATLLEGHRIDFMTSSEQSDLLQRILTAQAELQSAELLYNLSENEVGIDPQLVVKWHRLLLECGNVGRRYRQLHPRVEPDSTP
ncbi:DUF2605 family protein [Synechococcus sp. PCC 7336]|uniref:DUF2605 family protein n=1 Tax=Synechococcus sp. PCC 7336 TaxID=195250 RepID=UPI00034A48A9|nr:DUF2605 family protein [Synechococcus sp. PCC 7336]